jgi:hypothetical protein
MRAKPEPHVRASEIRLLLFFVAFPVVAAIVLGSTLYDGRPAWRWSSSSILMAGIRRRQHGSCRERQRQRLMLRPGAMMRRRNATPSKCSRLRT